MHLTNRWAVFDASEEDQLELKKFFRYRPPNYEFSFGYRNGGDGYKNLMQRGRVAAGLFLDRRAEVEKEIPLLVADERVFPKFREMGEASDRRYQNESVAGMIAASNSGGIVLAATGAGKTRLAGEYLRRLVGSGVFVVDELTLLEQTRRAFEALLGEPIGVVGRSEFAPRRVTVASVQTLQRHSKRADFKRWFKSVQAMIIDEIHVAVNRRSIDVVRKVSPLAVFGLTATLQMEKESVRMTAVALAGPVIFEYDIKTGTREGYLSKGVVCQLRFHDVLKGCAPGYETIRKVGGRDQQVIVESGSQEADYRYRVCLNKARNDCVEEMVREGVRRGRRVVVLVERHAHLNALSRRLEDVQHAKLSGRVASEIRFRAMKDMDAGKLNLILASRVFSRGVDVASVDCIIDATALPGRNAALQRYGRGVRKEKSKAGLIYVDVSDRGNRFSGSAAQRIQALKETGSSVIAADWGDLDAEELFITLERELRRAK